jgi:hypothetical protein
MTLAGIFGLVAESVGASGSRWWSSASYAMQALGVLIGTSSSWLKRLLLTHISSPTCRRAALDARLSVRAAVDRRATKRRTVVAYICAHLYRDCRSVARGTLLGFLLTVLLSLCHVSRIGIHRPPDAISRVVRPDLRFGMPSPALSPLSGPHRQICPRPSPS